MSILVEISSKFLQNYRIPYRRVIRLVMFEATRYTVPTGLQRLVITPCLI